MSHTAEDLLQISGYLRERLQRDYSTFRGYEKERHDIRQLLQRTAEFGESNSMLLIGPRDAGKTTLMNAVLTDLLSNDDFCENTLLVHLNGNFHTDDRLALMSVTLQMQLENATDGKVFGSFAENLAFLLACLKSGDKRSKSVVFILEEFDLFCAHHNQTLLYNLFDVSQSAQAPICVIGITSRLDVIELFEKRVKSRFSHRQVFLFPNTYNFEQYKSLFQQLLSIFSESETKAYLERIAVLKRLKSSELCFHTFHFNPTKYKITRKCAESWNKHIAGLCKQSAVIKALQALYEFDISEGLLKKFIFRLLIQLQALEQTQLTAELVSKNAAIYESDDKVELLCGLSVLEFCVIIAIKHHSDIYDRDPFNFEIIFARFQKFAKVSSSMQGIERAVVLKAFEHLRNIEFILPVSAGVSKVQKEFEMHRFTLTNGQINQTVLKYQALPTEIAQWAQSSLV